MTALVNSWYLPLFKEQEKIAASPCTVQMCCWRISHVASSLTIDVHFLVTTAIEWHHTWSHLMVSLLWFLLRALKHLPISYIIPNNVHTLPVQYDTKNTETKSRKDMSSGRPGSGVDIWHLLHLSANGPFISFAWYLSSWSAIHRWMYACHENDGAIPAWMKSI